MTAGIDVGRVTAWFAGNVPAAEAPLRFDRIAGGHSCLTFTVTDAGGERFVLRRPPLAHVLPTAHDVAREHRMMSALQGTGVPVPRMLGVCSDPAVNGAPFYVMSFVDGVVLHSAAEAVAKLPGDGARGRAAESLVDSLLSLHAVDIDAAGLSDFARRGGYLERQLKRWSAQWEASKTRSLPGMERLHAWLVAHRPAESRTSIVHGDYRLGNMIHGPDGTVLAVLDWELCTLGDPLADVSYLLRSWAPPAGEGDAAPPSAAPGFPPASELAARYVAGAGVALGDLDYWMAFNAWRSAAIVAGVYRRYVDGDMGAPPPEVERYARLVEVSLAAGLEAAGLS